MPIINALTDAIANPRFVRERQERAAERLYSGLDRKMQAVRDISPEPSPTLCNSQDSDSSSTFPSQGTSRVQSRAPSVQSIYRRPRPELHRSQSDLPIEPKLPVQSEFPPCITAIDLTADQITRNYSVNDLQKWDRAKSPLPPLSAMTGFGRYRHSIAADPQWRADRFRKQLSGIDCLGKMVSELDMSDINGMSGTEWKELTTKTVRRDSALSSNSTTTNSSTNGYELATDTSSGPRSVYGFDPSASSSPLSPQSRKGSNLSTVSKPSDNETYVYMKPLKKQSSSNTTDRRPSAALATIREQRSNQLTIPQVIKKVERPCDFSSSNDPDSAVASDVDDEDDENQWVDESEPKASAIAEMLNERRKSEVQPCLTRVRTTSTDKKRGRGSTTSIDRTRTVRNNPVQSKRRKSKTNETLHQNIKAHVKKDQEFDLALPPAESGEDDSELMFRLQGSDMVVREGQKQKGELKPCAEMRQNPTDDQTLLAEKELEFQPRAPRNRSATALRCGEDIQRLNLGTQQLA